jgi:O-antigen/teichoic acid export membrane protein
VSIFKERAEQDSAPSDQASTDTSRDLDRALVRGVAWTASVKWVTQVFTWGITVVVARLLLPSDYGLVGMAAIYINLFTLFSEFGIGTAVVTLQDLTQYQLSQLNTLSLFVGFLGSTISAAAAIPLGKFFRAPDLPSVVIVLSVGFTISGLRTVPYSLLQKELRFKLLAMIEGLQGVVQSLVTVLLAFLGFGYWALVLGILSFSVTPTILVLLWRRQNFAWPRLSYIRGAMHYSRHILIGRLSWAAYNDSDFIVAGRVLGAALLGAYTLAWTLAHTPLEKLTTLVNRVTPSVFAKTQNDTEALRRYLRNITGAMALVVFPAVIGMALVAKEFVLAVLGAKWIAVILPLQVLALHVLIRSNVILLTSLLNVVGQERLVMRNSLVAMVVLPVSFFVGSHWGILGIAAGWVLVYPLLQIPLFLRTFQRVGLSGSDYVKTMWPALNGCVVMGITVTLVKWNIATKCPQYMLLAIEILVGIVAYTVSLVLMHRPYLKAIVQLTKSMRLAR